VRVTIIPFPRVRRLVQRHDARRVLIAGVEDALASDLPSDPVEMDADVSVRYVPGSELARRSLEPDLWIEGRAPVAPDRTVLLLTLADDLLEQDEDGRLWCNDRSLEEGILVDAGARPGMHIAKGTTTALMSMHREREACVITIRVVGPVLWLFAEPRMLSPRPILEGWRTIAQELIRDRDK
jgi:hypothetical protein